MKNAEEFATIVYMLFVSILIALVASALFYFPLYKYCFRYCYLFIKLREGRGEGRKLSNQGMKEKKCDTELWEKFVKNKLKLKPSVNQKIGSCTIIDVVILLILHLKRDISDFLIH